MLNFDEFHAVRQRERSKKAIPDDPPSKQQKRNERQPKDDTTLGNRSSVGEADVTKTSANSFGLGDFLESHQTQSFIVFMIVLDTFASFLETRFANDSKFLSEVISVDFIRKLIISSLKSLTSFTLLFFSFEILAMLCVFRLSFLGHLGYSLDVAVVAGQMYLEFNGAGRETRILNILRFWRLVRLFISLVSAEKERHMTTKLLLEDKEDYIRRLEADNERLEIDLAKETEAKESIEGLLQNYKDEVDTLNEALKIAAMDIADVAQAEEDDEFSGDEEDLEEGDADDSNDNLDQFVDAASLGGYDKAKNIETLLRLARKDVITSTTQADVSANTSQSTGVAFLIHEDGSFERR